MFPAVLATVVVLCVLAGGLGVGDFTPGHTASDTESNSTTERPDSAEPTLVDLYPNPAAPGDPGEFVTLSVPARTNLSAYELADDHVRVNLSNGPSASDRSDETNITFSTDANRTESLTERTVVEISDRIRLADDGDRIRLLRNGTVVDEATYDRAPRAQVYDVQTEAWTPLGATDKPVVDERGGTVETFVLPDEPDRAVEFLETATERILLAGYTISAGDVVEALLEANERGVDVNVLADGAPVGGMGGNEAAALDRLDREGVPVQVIGGEKARYRFHHAKYAVVDERALVTTENWKPSGTGGKSSRGWAAITAQERIVSGLVDTFYADAGWKDAIAWDKFDDLTVVEAQDAQGSHPTVFEAETLPVEQTRLLVAPDNAEEEIVDAIETAEESIDIKQVQMRDTRFPFLRATLSAAQRGVEVRILLSGKWYAEAENRELKQDLHERAEKEDLPLQVRLADPEDEFEKIHAKGLITDEETTFVGSINWNNNSLRNNREVGLLLESEAVAAYFGEVFDSDWEEDNGWEVPVLFVFVCLAGVVVALAAARQLEFER